ncbi:MAG TPA: hypothetical protein VFV38_41065 [Ktedonobacteraceae bacterium]|nr:hypothetical protein [Ktedonobacteraceae bacterium]HEU5381855.1 hypothetical protein [Ktedonobacteraceae bacterium]
MRCNKLKVVLVKKQCLCKQCYKDSLAPTTLRRYVEEFTTPYPYNKAMFDLFVTTIDWETVTEKTRRTVCIFGHFLQTQPVAEPLTWEVVEHIQPPLGPTNRYKPKCIRACLLLLTDTLAKKGELESWETYVAKRHALSPLSYAPEHIRALLHRYANWLRERQSAPGNIYGHLTALASFWQWCEPYGVVAPEQVQASLVNNYLLSLYWQWRCSMCQGTMPFEPNHRTAPGSCTCCHALGSLTQQRRYAQNTVRTQRGSLFVFFDWLKISRMVVANPVQRKTPAPEPTIQHYSPDVIKQLCLYIRTPDADPTEAFILYLIIFHALSVWELRHAVLPAILPLRDDIAVPSLAEAYYIIVPRPLPSRGDRSPGRPDIRLDFPSAAASWLKPLLLRFEHQRQLIAGASRSSYVLLTPAAVRHNTVVGQIFTWKVVKQASQRLLNGACNPNTLRKTAGIMFADRAGAGVLRWMGWEEHQAFAYAYATREMVHPRPIDAPEREVQQKSTEPILFPSLKESTASQT